MMSMIANKQIPKTQKQLLPEALKVPSTRLLWIDTYILLPKKGQ